MEVYKWAEIRARRFSPEQIAAIQKEVAEELAKLELLTAPDQEAQGEPFQQEVKPTLFGAIQAGDITEEMIEEAKQALFRDRGEL